MSTLVHFKEQRKARRRFQILASLPFVLLPLFFSIISISKPQIFYNLFHERDISNGESPIILGLDFKGGSRVIYQVVSYRGNNKSYNADLEKSKKILLDRLNRDGNYEPSVKIEYEKKQIIVELPGISDIEKITEMIGQTASLEIYTLKDSINIDSINIYKVPDSILSALLFKKEDIKKVYVENEPHKQVVLEFNKDVKINQVLSKHINKKVVILLSGVAVEFLTVGDSFSDTSDGNIISIGRDDADLSDKTIKSYITIFNWETLPLNLNRKYIVKLNPTISEEQLYAGLVALLLGLILIFVYLIVFYGLYLGLTGCVALFYCIIIIAGISHASGLILNLPGLAGLILTAGISVDSFILIFEEIKSTIRIRQEANIDIFDEDAIWSAIQKITGHLWTLRFTTMVGCLVLMFFSGPIKGFATTTIIGLLVSIIVSSKFIIGGMLIYLENFGRDINQRTYGIPVFENKATEKIFKQILNNKFIPLFSSLIFISSIVTIYIKGFTYTNDFVPGTEISLSKSTPVANPEQVESLLKEYCQKNTIEVFSMQQIVKDGNSEALLLKVNQLSGYQLDRMNNFLQKEGYGFDKIDIWNVDSLVDKDSLNNWILAILLSLLSIFLYCLTPFTKISVAGYTLLPISIAILAVFHDIIIVLGILSLSGVSLSIPVFSAIVSLTGYSINDSLILLNRMNVVAKSMHVIDGHKLVEESMLSVKSRTLHTILTTAIGIIPALFINVGFIKPFVLTVFVSLVVGTYSSFFIVGPLLEKIFLRNNKKEQRKIRI